MCGCVFFASKQKHVIFLLFFCLKWKKVGNGNFNRFFQTFSSSYQNDRKQTLAAVEKEWDSSLHYWINASRADPPSSIFLGNKHISPHSLTKLNWSGSTRDIFPEDKGQRVRSLYLGSAGLCFWFQNVMGLWVNKSHLMIEREVVFPFNEARKQFIWPDWPQAITLSTFLNQ